MVIEGGGWEGWKWKRWGMGEWSWRGKNSRSVINLLNIQLKIQHEQVNDACLYAIKNVCTKVLTTEL